MSRSIGGHGLRVALPDRWEARLYLRDRPEQRVAAPWTHPAAHGHPGESPNPVLHLANFALPADRGDFGTGAVERMGAEHAFIALLEYDREEAGRALFADRRRPMLAVDDFAANALQRRRPGQLGCQRFFTEAGRPFCLYVVLGSRRHAGALVAQVRRVVRAITVSSASELSRP